MLWFFMICNLLTPFIMIVFGRLWQDRPPKEINSVYGYRTSRSTQNEETWEFAHAFVGRLWFRLGRVLAGITIAAGILLNGTPAFLAGMTAVLILQMVMLILTIPITERRLQLEFDRYGCRRKRR